MTIGLYDIPCHIIRYLLYFLEVASSTCVLSLSQLSPFELISPFEAGAEQRWAYNSGEAARSLSGKGAERRRDATHLLLRERREE